GGHRGRQGQVGQVLLGPEHDPARDGGEREPGRTQVAGPVLRRDAEAGLQGLHHRQPRPPRFEATAGGGRVIPSVFREVWSLDTEFRQPDGERPTAICLTARELFSDRVVQRWLWDKPNPRPPFAAGTGTLFITYMGTAEWGTFLSLGWPLPLR